jgi:hypothetical protein
LNFDENQARENRKLQMQELEEMRSHAYKSSKLYKDQVKSYHDKRIVNKEFNPGRWSYCSIQDLNYFQES